MTPLSIRLTVGLLGVLIGGVAVGSASQSAPLPGGASAYGLYCATCHGTGGRGDGPMARVLTKRPADLTRLAARNRGTFDPQFVARIIDGRSPVRGHGGGDMPVWGDAFAKSTDPTPSDEKIVRIVSFLESIQERP